jgi:hypothetical protein
MKLVPNQPRVSLLATVRAVLITLVIMLQCVSAAPGQPLNRHHLGTIEGKQFITWVQDALSTLGFERSRQAIELASIESTTRLVAVRNAVVSPFEPVLRALGSHQGWALFQLGSRECFRIHVDSRAVGSDWTVVYRAQGEDRLDLAATLRYRRVRGVYNPGINRGVSAQYDGFVTWLARRVFAADAHAAELRVRMQRIDRGTRDFPPRALGFEYERHRTRDDVL